MMMRANCESELKKKNSSEKIFEKSKENFTERTKDDNLIHELFNNKLQYSEKKIRSTSCSTIIKSYAIRKLIKAKPEVKSQKLHFKQGIYSTNLIDIPTSYELNKKFLAIKQENPQKIAFFKENNSTCKHTKSKSMFFESNFKGNSLRKSFVPQLLYSAQKTPRNNFEIPIAFLPLATSHHKERTQRSFTSFASSSVSQKKRKTSIRKAYNHSRGLLHENKINEENLATPLKLNIKQENLKNGFFFLKKLCNLKKMVKVF